MEWLGLVVINNLTRRFTKMDTYDYDDIDADVYSFYLSSLASHGDKFVAIAEASVFFMEDETFIEDIIGKYERGEQDDADTTND